MSAMYLYPLAGHHNVPCYATWILSNCRMQDPDKFIEQADQEQQELRRKLEDATERIKTIQVRTATPLPQPARRMCSKKAADIASSP